MSRRAWLLVAVVVLAAAVAAVRRSRARHAGRVVAPEWPPLPEPQPEPEAASQAGPVAPATTPPWVPPVGGACPAGYPVKVKLGSGIYHLPGMLNYARTTPDRCYASSTAAEEDGFRAAKR